MTLWTWIAIASVTLLALFAAAAIAARNNGDALRQLLRLVPDCLALLRSLMRDPDVPRRAKLIATGTVAYLALPIDLIPDFIPGLGHLDDVLVVAWALRHIIRSAGHGRVAGHWRGDPATLERILRLVRAA